LDINTILSTYDDIVEEWRRVKLLLDERLEEISGASSEAGLVDVTRYIVRGGKRFRGFVTVVSAKALGASEEEALDAATAIELVHSASLAIDDIIDKDTIRRGVKVAWIVYGVEKAVLASLLMIPVAQRMIERYGFSAIMHVIRSWEETVRGEILDAFSADRMPAKDYFKLTSLKTGSLFKLAVVLGAIAARAKWALKGLSEYGLKLGITYQLADDIVDYYEYIKGIKKKLDPSERLFERWAKEVLGARSEGEVISLAIDRLKGEAEETSERISFLPPSKWKRILQAIPFFISEKMLEKEGLRLDLQ
jgi:geranylgeranyl pyrophosphate synthase